MFTAVLDESGSPHLPASEKNTYFSVGVLIPKDSVALRSRVAVARQQCPDERTTRRGFFHASEDSRDARKFLAEHLRGVDFYFRMLFADKRVTEHLHNVKKARHLHRILVREAIKMGISEHCRAVELLVGTHPETLRSEEAVREILAHHDSLQILEAMTFPYGNTIRTRFDRIKMVTPSEEPLMDVVDYLIWAHQRDQLKDDEHDYLFLGASMMRGTLGGAHRFPGVRHIFTFSTWSPQDPVVQTMPFRSFHDSQKTLALIRVLGGLKLCALRGQKSRHLEIAFNSGTEILGGDTRTETLLGFGGALLEVLDTEAVPIQLSEDEFCKIKTGAALCAWLGRKRMHKPPIDGWEKMLADFFSLITGQEVVVS